MKSIKQIRSHLEQQKGEKKRLVSMLKDTNNTVSEKKRDLQHHEQAREVIREVGLKTQQSLAFHISDITSLALEAVFDNPYQLKIDFVQRRNKTECDLFFERGSKTINPLDASGGGAVDVASFALRVACWSMETPRKRPVMIMDEPMKFVSESGGLQERASQMIKELSDRLGIQFIIVSHEETLTQSADKVFQVNLNKGVSKIQS